MGLGIPPLETKIMLESNPLKSRILVGRLAVTERALGGREGKCRESGLDSRALRDFPGTLRSRGLRGRRGRTCYHYHYHVYFYY